MGAVPRYLGIATNTRKVTELVEKSRKKVGDGEETAKNAAILRGRAFWAARFRPRKTETKTTAQPAPPSAGPLPGAA
jgi:hypothetical protein